MDKDKLQNTEETIQLLKFARNVTENIRKALCKPQKPHRKKINHRRYIQKQCKYFFVDCKSQERGQLNDVKKIKSDKLERLHQMPNERRSDTSNLLQYGNIDTSLQMSKETHQPWFSTSELNEMNERAYLNMEEQAAQMQFRQIWENGQEIQNHYHYHDKLNRSENAPPRLSHFNFELVPKETKIHPKNSAVKLTSEYNSFWVPPSPIIAGIF